jgi:hypothetical protein
MPSAEELRRWIHGRRAAEERELREIVDESLTPSRSLAAALSLIALARSRHGWPFPTDPSTAEEEGRAWEAWARLRRSAHR